MATLKKGDEVSWKYGTGTANGRIDKVSDHDITKTIKGKQVKRKGSADEPALVIKQDNGNQVVKSASEVRKH
ncbi:hypervirulence associated TUDOR domain-containing protein [Arsenicibacter rosenii]|uniref:Hypervirulence associated protein TUDOR domain-containing protein n=1 Tax=Arsenicibacter rosenii TaxID=1750698 RepID=A0A1S2VH57_9BACT|nr:DUF2945 domain-containing protein [Arsenicibacter rosenii]OIN58059.1 hypothetical protein BLX24_16145 [Arsenicibacter rosenii]